MRFVGAPHGTDIVDPAVRPSMSPVAAARAHLARYGAAFGADGPGTTLIDPTVGSTSNGVSVVRLQQQVDGIPVVAGQTAVTMYADRGLSSIQADLSTASSVPAPTVDQGRARRTAGASVGRGARATDSGRWLLDPAVIGMPSSRGAQGVWRFVVTAASGTSSDVMVDDATGRVLLSVPLEESIGTRVVCDRANVGADPNSPDPLCQSGYARAEGDPATGNADVDSAYDLAGATSDFYGSLSVNLTDLIGRRVTGDTAGPKRLESTVRFCYSGYTCPYANAFWDGNGMYYGQGWATADDVVGHEMTHGVTEHTSNLFYWGQSGAINESISDIMGEIVDHRNLTPGEDNSAWLLGEDSPVGAIRSMKDPTLYGQPDTMTSAQWYQGTSDAGGVHTNSGVGNRTAYLISQGGVVVGGQTSTGIDGSDPLLAKSARLWLDVDERLISGSDYSDLAAVLQQTCSDLIGTDGFTAADCVSVGQAIGDSGTALRTAPAAVPAVPVDCPNGGVRRDLYDEHTNPGPGHGLSPTDAPTLWHAPSNATGSTPGPSSSLDYWVADDVPTAQASSLSGVYADLPSGQSSYLKFRHRFLLDYGGGYYYDGGTVDIQSGGDPSAPLTWTGNGPTRTLYGTNTVAFSGDSVGWWTSQLDLSSDAGTWVEPRFTLHTDNDYADGQNTDYSKVGWYVDDVAIYTCDLKATNTVAPRVPANARVGTILTANPGTWTPGATYAYQWLRNGSQIAGATDRSYRVAAADLGKHLSVRVTASVEGIDPGSATSGTTLLVTPGYLTTSAPVLTGILRVGKTLTARPGTWGPAGVILSYHWFRDGKPIAGTRRTHRLVAADRGHYFRVKVVGHLAGYTTVTRVSAVTARVR